MNTLPALTILIYSMDSGGAERVTSILLAEISRHYQLTLVLMNDTIKYDIPSNIQVVYLENSKATEPGILKLIKLPFLAYKYHKLCRKNNTQYSLSFMNRPNFINVLSRIFGNKSKIIISERAAPSEVYKTSSLGNKIARILIVALYPQADLIIPNSVGIQHDLTNHFNISREKFIVINNPIDINKLQKMSLDAVDDIIFNKFTFISLGRLHPQKNHALLIKSFSKLKSDAQLIILGEGELRKKLQNLIVELDLTQRVFLIGNRNNPFKYLSNADCFVFSSDYEGFPNAILEALACNLPVISTDCKTGPREILALNGDATRQLTSNAEQSDFGILTPVGDSERLVESMVSIIANNELRNSYKRKSALRANDFNKDIIAQQYLDAIKITSKM